MPQRKLKGRRRAAPAAQQAAPPPSEPLHALLSAANLSPSAAEAEQPEPVSAPSSDSDAAAQPRPRKQRKKVGRYNTPLTEQQRLDILRMHIVDGMSAPAIATLLLGKGTVVPEGTIYTLISKQAHGKPIMPQPRHRSTKYGDEDKQVIVEAQLADNDARYEDLRAAWRTAFPDKVGAPSNDSIHKWLVEADITTKQLYKVPVTRNKPENILARKEYSLRAMTWSRDRLIFIDETTFSKGGHRKRGRSKKGTMATYTSLNSGGKGLKVCAAVSPIYGLLQYELQLQAYSGQSFAVFMQKLCANPAVRQQSMIMVMDNVYLHFTQEVQDVLAAQAVHHDIVRLPVYSPHLNPIEYTFSKWKNEMKHIDQLTDRRTLLQQIEDTRVVVTDKYVWKILEHVFQLYSHCIELLPLEEFKPIGHRVARAREEAELQRAVIAAGAEETEEKCP